MKISANALRLLTKPSEGLKLQAYPDPGTGGAPWTIGYGHTKNVKPTDSCTRAQADAWLVSDVEEAEKTVSTYVRVPLSQCQFDALVDFVFNIGSGSFRESTLLRRLNKSDYVGASAQFSRWVYGGNKILPGLVTRRRLETEWFIKGG